MELLERFLLTALPLAGEALAPIVRDFYAANRLTPPPEIAPWLAVDARIDAALRASAATLDESCRPCPTPPLSNGLARVSYDPVDAVGEWAGQRGVVSVLVTEDVPVLLVPVDSGLELRTSPPGYAPWPGVMVSAHRVSPAPRLVTSKTLESDDDAPKAWIPVLPSINKRGRAWGQLSTQEQDEIAPLYPDWTPRDFATSFWVRRTR